MSLRPGIELSAGARSALRRFGQEHRRHAEASVPDPVLTALRAGPWAEPVAVARALARELLPDESPVTPPAWLLPDQVPSLRRVVAALRRYRGAVLADPVGSGKTYVALAAAAAMAPRRAATCLVPSALIPQWRDTAGSLGVNVVLLSHEQVAGAAANPDETGGDRRSPDSEPRAAGIGTRRHGWSDGRHCWSPHTGGEPAPDLFTSCCSASATARSSRRRSLPACLLMAGRAHQRSTAS
jgi:hypothetical protein